MPVDTQQIIAEAEKLGQLVAQHPAVSKYKEAQRAVASDPDASRLLADFDRTLEALGRQEQAGMPVTDAQRMQLEGLQGRIISHLKIKALNLSQVEFVDLLRKVTQMIQAQVQGGAPAAGGGPGGGAPSAAPAPSKLVM
jgi:cell fate (sporulation/competence/biofilm development) regulator YlbF (YheA/YmcA/DUF963 family)